LSLDTTGRPAELFVTLIELPDVCRPCRARRRYGITLLAVDPRDDRMHIATWVVDNLTREEIDVLRRSYGMPPVHRRADDRALLGPCLLWVPPSLRLPNAPALQGGRELARRQAVGQLREEITLWRREAQEQTA
jgi:hypothetical protein